MKEDQCDFQLIWQTVLKTPKKHWEVIGRWLTSRKLSCKKWRCDRGIDGPTFSSVFFFSQKFSPRFVVVLHLILNVLACINVTCVCCKICERLSQKNYSLDQMIAIILLRWSSSRVQVNKQIKFLLCSWLHWVICMQFNSMMARMCLLAANSSAIVPALHLLPFIFISATGELKSPKGNVQRR